MVAANEQSLNLSCVHTGISRVSGGTVRAHIGVLACFGAAREVSLAHCGWQYAVYTALALKKLQMDFRLFSMLAFAS